MASSPLLGTVSHAGMQWLTLHVSGTVERLKLGNGGSDEHTFLHLSNGANGRLGNLQSAGSASFTSSLYCRAGLD
jgi:hypothetical protein